VFVIFDFIKSMPIETREPTRVEQAPEKKERSFVFETSVEARGYKKWREEVPGQVRQLVEGQLADRKTRVNAEHTPLVGQFYGGIKSLLDDPFANAEDFEDVDPRVQKQLTALQNIKVEVESEDEGQHEEILNMFSALADEAIDFVAKKVGITQTKEIRVERMNEILNKYLLPHIGVEESDKKKKAINLCKILRKFILTETKQRPFDDKDNYANKRLKLTGKLMADLMRVNMKVLIGDLLYTRPCPCHPEHYFRSYLVSMP